MDTGLRPSRLKLIVSVQALLGLLLLPATNAALHFSGRHPWTQDSSRVVPTLLFALAAVVATYGGAAYGAQRIAREARRFAAPEPQARHDALVMFVSIGGFLAMYGFSVTETVGWGWGAGFYGIYLLYWADMHHRWRGYREVLAEADAAAREDSVR